eukprot:156195_1
MSASSRSSILFKCLYRNLLKQSRIIEESPITQCFLISKPRKVYIHEYGCPVNVRLHNPDFEIVERMLNEHCGGEYFAPSLPNKATKSLQSLIKQCFRFGIPSKYDTAKILDTSSKTHQDMSNKYLELAFYAKKRLSYSTNVINKMASSNGPHTTEHEDDDALAIPTQSLVPITTFHHTSKQEEEEHISKGTLLISHPLSCLGQPDLYRKVIYIIETSADRIVGITLNAAHSLFDDAIRTKKRRKSTKSVSSDFEYCFRGWKGEWNYAGGPVNDQNCPFCILHENSLFYDKFKTSSTVILDDEERPTYWTWVTVDNYQAIYQSLNQITRIIQHKEKGNMNAEPEISGKNEEQKEETVESVDDAQIVSENSGDSDLNNEIESDEFYDSIMSDSDNNFKFFQKYSYWSPEQLVVEIKNNVWFPAKLTDVVEERELLNLKCPAPKMVKSKGNKDSRIDYKKQFNKKMWQGFVAALGNEYRELAMFPELNNEQTKEFYAFLEEFHTYWVPDVEAAEHEPFDSDDDEPEEEDTIW